MFSHPLKPLYPAFEHTCSHCLVNLAENFSDCLQGLWPAHAIFARHFFFDISKEEEFILSNVRAVRWMREPFAIGDPDTLLGSPRIVRMCAVHLDNPSFQRLFTVS
jgi:hypothetical protein